MSLIKLKGYLLKNSKSQKYICAGELPLIRFPFITPYGGKKGNGGEDVGIQKMSFQRDGLFFYMLYTFGNKWITLRPPRFTDFNSAD